MQRSLVSPVIFLFAFVATGVVCAGRANGQSTKSRCDALLSPEEIGKATGMAVGEGEKGPKFAGARRSCVWQGSDGSKIIVLLTDAEPMQMTMESMAQTGGALYDGLGTIAVGTKGIPETGGGYNLSFLDAKGGVAITIPGSAGTSDRTVALGKLIADRRASADAPRNQKPGTPAHGHVASGQGQTAQTQP